MPLIDLVNESGNDEVILSLWLGISINWQLWAHIYNPKWYGLPWFLIYNMAGVCIYRLLQAVTSQFAALQQKYNCPFTKKDCCSELRLWNVGHKWAVKDLTTMETTSWQTERTHMGWSKGLNRPFIEKKEKKKKRKKRGFLLKNQSISTDLKGPERTLGAWF